MMSDKENSGSVNIIGHNPGTVPLLPKVSIKKEPLCFSTKAIKKDPSYPEIECEVILYVDNREKKNQQQGNYIYNKLIDSNVYCE